MDTKKLKTLLISKKTALITAAAILGIMLLVLSYLPKNTTKVSENGTPDDYISKLEAGLESSLSKINGAGKTEVFITVSGTYETVYASNASIDESTNGKTTEKKLAYAQSKSFSQSPVVIKELYPDIKGVLIVCEGGNNPDIKKEIINAASVALGISQSKIYVTGGKD